MQQDGANQPAIASFVLHFERTAGGAREFLIEDDIEPVVGMGLEVAGEDDEEYMVTVVGVTDEAVELDTNHPLAGEELTYEFELVEILS